MINTTFAQKIVNEKTHLSKCAKMFTNNIDDRNDLIQETILKALVYQSYYKDYTNIKAWLFSIMRNTFINNYRRAGKIKKIIDITDNTFLIDISTNTIDNSAEMKFIRKDIEMALNNLPPMLKSIYLRNLEGYKYQEIAEEFSIPLGTVKTRIFVAKKMLRKTLISYNEEYHKEYA